MIVGDIASRSSDVFDTRYD